MQRTRELCRTASAQYSRLIHGMAYGGVAGSGTRGTLLAGMSPEEKARIAGWIVVPLVVGFLGWAVWWIVKDGRRRAARRIQGADAPPVNGAGAPNGRPPHGRPSGARERPIPERPGRGSGAGQRPSRARERGRIVTSGEIEPPHLREERHARMAALTAQRGRPVVILPLHSNDYSDCARLVDGDAVHVPVTVVEVQRTDGVTEMRIGVGEGTEGLVSEGESIVGAPKLVRAEHRPNGGSVVGTRRPIFFHRPTPAYEPRHSPPTSDREPDVHRRERASDEPSADLPPLEQRRWRLRKQMADPDKLRIVQQSDDFVGLPDMVKYVVVERADVPDGEHAWELRVAAAHEPSNHLVLPGERVVAAGRLYSARFTDRRRTIGIDGHSGVNPTAHDQLVLVQRWMQQQLGVAVNILGNAATPPRRGDR